MNLNLCPEAIDLGRIARQALESAGGDTFLVEAESSPHLRAKAEPILDGLGTWDLDVRSSADELEAGAAVCRAAGYFAIPYPVAERLCRPRELDFDAVAVVSDSRPQASAQGVELRWLAVDLYGNRSSATSNSVVSPARRTLFVTDLDLEPLDRVGHTEVALGLVLPCWTLLGYLDRAMELTRTYVVERHQFGQPLSSFQGVQFELTDAEVERIGIEELAKYALWSLGVGHPDVLVDALALRSAIVEAADVVFRVAHQLHGAIGFCDETPLSWLSRYSGPLRRLPTGLSETRSALSCRLETSPLPGIFSESPRR